MFSFSRKTHGGVFPALQPATCVICVARPTRTCALVECGTGSGLVWSGLVWHGCGSGTGSGEDYYYDSGGSLELFRCRAKSESVSVSVSVSGLGFAFVSSFGLPLIDLCAAF